MKAQLSFLCLAAVALGLAGARGAESSAPPRSEPYVWRNVVIGGGGYLYHRMPEERRDGVRNGLEQALNVAAAFSAEYVAAITRMNRALPAAPSRERLAGEQQRRNVLTRACLHALGRAQGHQSAVELAELLPSLGVGQSAPLVREVLYKYPGCFESVYSGRWQVGTALVRAPRGIDESS